ncbi:MAG TPA: SMP-30/gluconolactonase/LRE family protein [Saprospiraceae bacterium]|nr:SMP-30/gluconolactonase/LRE family protein [Saprospiraceae bacterium]HMQ84145.1 SMP-30/gluconolactonase/LRE family protein [Saprospiraceae bacterium]
MKNWYSGLVVLALLVLVLVGRTLWYAGTFKVLKPHSTSEKITTIPGMMGAEDITFDHQTGVALISSYDRRSVRAGVPAKGAIYQLDFSTSPPRIVDLTLAFEQADFHPHGIALFMDPVDGSKWLLAVNHRDSFHCVEIFRYTDTALVHSETIRSPLMVSPNDLVATGKRSFYFTNDHGEPGGVSHWKDFLVIGTGQVGYFDGQEVKILAKGIRYANGINISQDGKTLYVAATTDGSIIQYEVAPFRRIGKINCRTGVDNLEWDEHGNLWVGAHPKMLAFLGHSKSAQKQSPSQILKVYWEEEQQAQVEEIYLSKGEPLSGSSVAAVFQNRLLMGTVFEDGILELYLE